MNISDFTQELLKIEEKQIQELKNLIDSHQEIIILGNGGSNSIASHISQDYTKQLKKRAFTFSDPSRLTCYINDYGMDQAYSRFLQEFSNHSSLVILISSSGESKNIINCAEFCKNNKINFIIFTGFKQTNSLRQIYSKDSLLDLWVNSTSYGVVECLHQVFLHTPC
jgi:D-sedoheptulose 7-phosphate isomerase